MAKIKIVLMVTQEFEPKKEYYPDGMTIEQMAELERQQALSDPYMFIDSRYVSQTTAIAEVVK